MSLLKTRYIFPVEPDSFEYDLSHCVFQPRYLEAVACVELSRKNCPGPVIPARSAPWNSQRKIADLDPFPQPALFEIQHRLPVTGFPGSSKKRNDAIVKSGDISSKSCREPDPVLRRWSLLFHLFAKPLPVHIPQPETNSRFVVKRVLPIHLDASPDDRRPFRLGVNIPDNRSAGPFCQPSFTGSVNNDFCRHGLPPGCVFNENAADAAVFHNRITDVCREKSLASGLLHHLRGDIGDGARRMGIVVSDAFHCRLHPV